MTTVPIIITERLRLREPTLADWPRFAELMTSDRTRFMGGPFSIQSAWGTFCQGIALWRLSGVGALSMELAQTGDWIGQVEINQGPRFPEPELGWQIHIEAEGKGYAFEASLAMRKWAVGTGMVDRLVSYIGPDNRRSIRLAQRLAATLDAHAEPQDPGDLVYRHLP